MLAVWENSYDVEQNFGTIGKFNYDNHILKTFKVGRTYKGVLQSESSSNEFVSATGTQGFTSQQLTKEITLRFYNIKENKLMFKSLSEGGLMLRFFELPNFNSELTYSQKVFNDQSRNLFYCDRESTVVGYEDEDNIGYIDITFRSINSRINKTGVALNSYIQMGGPGEPYAFPLLIKPNKIVLDPQRLQPIPVTHAQIQILGISGVNSIQFRGRPVYSSEYKRTTKYKIHPPCTLNFYIMRKSINNQITLKAFPEDVQY